MSIYFTSDTHFGHSNIIRYCNRPFANVREMNETLISNWNSVVGSNDTVYHLGDFSFGWAEQYFNRLNGNIHWVHGNHDRDAWQIRKRFVSHSPLMHVNVDMGDRRPQSIVLCHYAMRVWNKAHHGAWHLYGHSHGTLEDVPYGKSFDVGVDCHDYFPISVERVKEIMDSRTFEAVDHHKG